MKPLKVDIKNQGVEQGGGGFYFLQSEANQYAFKDSTFTASELKSIINIGKDCGLSNGMTGNGHDYKARDSLVSFIYPNEMTMWVFEKLASAIDEVNFRYFKFDLHGMFQGLQFTEYHAPGNHYTWHQDMGSGMMNRKLSLSLQLSEPQDYDGGNLELMTHDKPFAVEKFSGRISFFPSWVVHRVTPVTRGTRYSLVAWVSGPPFR
jgi:PKHD-type hydroxylase